MCRQTEKRKASSEVYASIVYLWPIRLTVNGNQRRRTPQPVIRAVLGLTVLSFFRGPEGDGPPSKYNSVLTSVTWKTANGNDLCCTIVLCYSLYSQAPLPRSILSAGRQLSQYLAGKSP